MDPIDDDMNPYKNPKLQSCLCTLTYTWLKRSSYDHRLHVVDIQLNMMNTYSSTNVSSSNFLHMFHASTEYPEKA